MQILHALSVRVRITNKLIDYSFWDPLERTKKAHSENGRNSAWSLILREILFPKPHGQTMPFTISDPRSHFALPSPIKRREFQLLPSNEKFHVFSVFRAVPGELGQ